MSEKSILEKVRKKFQTRRSEIEKESENKLQKLQDKIEHIKKEREFFISAFYPSRAEVVRTPDGKCL